MFTRLKRDTPGVAELLNAPLPFDDILSSPYSYEQGIIKYIDAAHQGHVASSITNLYSRLLEPVIKIEGIEKLNRAFFEGCNTLAIHLGHKGPVTCHLFKSPAGGASFPLHTDPDTVVVVLLSGIKVFRNPECSIELHEGDVMQMPAHYPHEAINITENTMLSIGLESFIIEKL